MTQRQKFCLVCSLAIFVVMLAAAGCSSSATTSSTMAGFWADTENNTTTINEQNGAFAAVTVYDLDQSHSQNSLVSSSYVNGVLTWKYCPPAQACLTVHTVSLSGNTLNVAWTNDRGESGQMTLKRVDKGTN
jgi:hypothetical protein